MYHVGSLDRLQKSTLYVKQIYPKYIHLLRYADDTTLMAESEKELKSLWIKVKEESIKLA